MKDNQKIYINYHESFRKKLEALKEIYSLKTNTKLIIFLVEMECKKHNV